MPELPEVEVVRSQVESLLAGQTLASISADPSPRFREAPLAQGSTVCSVERRGKYLLWALQPLPAVVIVHLGMTGQLLSAGPPENHVRAHWVLHDGAQLWLRDPRGFGRVCVRPASGPWGLATLDALGPDLLDPHLDVPAVAAALSGRSAPLKALLLDQRAVAGIGNYIADEALGRAKVAPTARRVSPARASRVVVSAVRVAQESLRAGGVSERDYVHVDGGRGSYAESLQFYGRAGCPCPHCQSPLQRSVVAGRGSTWCRRCQRS